MATIHYKSSDGVSGYSEGDVLICDDTGERSKAVRTGHGLQLEPMPTRFGVVADRLARALGTHRGIASLDALLAELREILEILKDLDRAGVTPPTPGVTPHEDWATNKLARALHSYDVVRRGIADRRPGDYIPQGYEDPYPSTLRGEAREALAHLRRLDGAARPLWIDDWLDEVKP